MEYDFFEELLKYGYAQGIKEIEPDSNSEAETAPETTEESSGEQPAELEQDADLGFETSPVDKNMVREEHAIFFGAYYKMIQEMGIGDEIKIKVVRATLNNVKIKHYINRYGRVKNRDEFLNDAERVITQKFNEREELENLSLREKIRTAYNAVKNKFFMKEDGKMSKEGLWTMIRMAEAEEEEDKISYNFASEGIVDAVVSESIIHDIAGDPLSEGELEEIRGILVQKNNVPNEYKKSKRGGEMLR